MRIERHVQIDRPSEEVFGFISDPNNDPVWCPTVSESRQIRGADPNPGSVYVQTHKPGPGKPTELEVELLEVDPPHHLRLKSTDELAWFDVRYRLEDLSGGGTLLTQIDETHFEGRARLLQPIMWIAIHRGVARQFEELKRILESHAPTGPTTGE